MKTRILALAAIAVLALTAVAVAKTNKLTGKFKNGGNVTIKVKLSKKGTPSKVTSFTATNVTSQCSNQRGDKVPGKTVAKAKLGSFKITKTKSGGKTYYNVIGGRKVDGNQWNIESAFSSKKGRKISGTASFNYADPNPNGGGTCDGAGKFSAKVK